MEDKLYIEQFKERFRNQSLITSHDIFEFYRTISPNILKSSVNWKVYELDKSGIISRKARGVFSLERSIIYKPYFSINLKRISNKIKKSFPFVNLCVWNTNIINDFAHHQVSLNFNIIEIERQSLDSIYLQIKDEFTPSLLKPESLTFDKLSYKSKHIYIFLPLISEAPIQKVQYISTVTLEKLLVDLFSDDIWSNFKGAELLRIFEKAFNKYSINYSKLLRYASRKGKKEELFDFLSANNLLMHPTTGATYDKP